MNTPLKAALKPCPFCGSTPRLVDAAGWEVWCDCGANLCLGDNPSREAVSAAWNHRAVGDVLAKGYLGSGYVGRDTDKDHLLSLSYETQAYAIRAQEAIADLVDAAISKDEGSA